MNDIRCPENIVKMFDSPATIDEGRKLAIEWLRGAVDGMPEGSTFLIPDAVTGELLRYTKTAKIQ